MLDLNNIWYDAVFAPLFGSTLHELTDEQQHLFDNEGLEAFISFQLGESRFRALRNGDLIVLVAWEGQEMLDAGYFETTADVFCAVDVCTSARGVVIETGGGSDENYVALARLLGDLLLAQSKVRETDNATSQPDRA